MTDPKDLHDATCALMWAAEEFCPDCEGRDEHEKIKLEVTVGDVRELHDAWSKAHRHVSYTDWLRTSHDD